MTEELQTCDLTCSSTSSDPEETLNAVKSRIMECEQPIFSVLGGGMKPHGAGGHSAVPNTCGGATSPTATTSDNESGIFSVESELCVEHEAELDWFCGTEQKLICSHCAIVGSCHGHTVTPVATRVTAVRVSVSTARCVRAQQLHPAVCSSVLCQAAANRAREQVLAQVSAAREALEEEEQRLLEEVQREEERVEQCLLTQRAHWNQALSSLSQTRLNGVLHLLCLCGFVRVEEAEGVGEPCDTNILNLNPNCSDSTLLRGLWAAALLLGPNAYGSSVLKFDERTVNPLLSLSEDFCTLTFLRKKPRQPQPYDPARFDHWPNALGSLSMSSGTHSWVVDVGQSAAFKVGVCYASLERKGSGDEARLGHNSQSWVLAHYDGDYSFCHAGKKVPLQVVKKPQRIGLLLDWPSQTLMFYEPDSCAVLYSLTEQFSAPLLPACAVTDRSITILH
uniref:B-box and SPRY domain containing n=1 Tax=Amphiprion percula TaxID=161767 RepID=A0A3P8T669_AMPPE